MKRKEEKKRRKGESRERPQARQRAAAPLAVRNPFSFNLRSLFKMCK